MMTLTLHAYQEQLAEVGGKTKTKRIAFMIDG
jgi:hypothetical protein